MELTRGKKIALGLATLWPLLYIGLFFLFILTMAFGMSDPDSRALVAPAEGGGPPTLFLAIVPAHLCTMVISVGLLFVYVLLVVKNPRLTDTMKIIWTMLILFLGMIAMPAYYWLEVWKQRPTGADAGGSPDAAPEGEGGGFATPPGT